MPLMPNNAKRKMRAGEVALGFGVHHLRSIATPAIAAATGHDWLFLDNEHGAFSVSEIAQLCMAALPIAVTPLVRVCANAIDEATRALDNGALGIVMPHVDTATEALRIAEAFRYPPLGRRSWGGPPAVYGFQPPSMAEAQKAINDEILTVVMIESPEAVKNAADIAAVDGIDVLFIGTSDLSSELGIAGQMGHQKVIDAYAAVGAACTKHGKILGMGGVYDEENALPRCRTGSGTERSPSTTLGNSTASEYTAKRDHHGRVGQPGVGDQHDEQRERRQRVQHAGQARAPAGRASPSGRRRCRAAPR